jgi:hypothetical protein
MVGRSTAGHPPPNTRDLTVTKNHLFAFAKKQHLSEQPGTKRFDIVMALTESMAIQLHPANEKCDVTLPHPHAC